VEVKNMMKGAVAARQTGDEEFELILSLTRLQFHNLKYRL
jgi:hypothetical protein